MRKNKMMRAASVLLVAVLLTTCAISGTFAKYTSTYSASSSANVAKWSFLVGGENGNALTDNFSFDMFSSVYDLDGNGNVYPGGDVDTDVANTTGEQNKLIAPGTGGYATLTLYNASEVNAKYAVDFTVTNSENIPVQFSTDNNTWKDSLDDLDISETSIGMKGTATITVYWRWAFTVSNSDSDTSTSTRDNQDTNLGTKDTAPTLTVKATVTVTQVD